jgi:transcriptional regulator with XRE-family HTH domain
MMIGEALRLIRVFHNLKQTEAAEKIGISQSHVSELERGAKIPTLDVIEKYAEAFDIPASSIIYFSENIRPQTRATRSVANKILKLLQFIEHRSGRPDEP